MKLKHAKTLGRVRILVPTSVPFRPMTTVQMPNLAIIETKRILVCIANIVMIKHGAISTNRRPRGIKELKPLL